jgi:hypothetical protein
MSIELDRTLLLAALEGFESQLARLEEQIAYVRSVASGKKVAAPVAPAVEAKAASGKKGRAVSDEGRRRMAEAQKRRWAKVHADKAS